MYNGKKFSLIARNMGRKTYLQQSIATWTSLTNIDEIKIVNWGQIDDLSTISTDPRVTIINVPDKTSFDPGAAHNTGCRSATGDYLMLVDCDIKLQPTIFNAMNTATFPSTFFTTSDVIVRNSIVPRFGILVISSTLFSTVKFSEGIESYGLEDTDFTERAEAAGYPRSTSINNSMWTHISHPDSLRVQYFINKTKFQPSTGTIPTV
jgi:glycosyltransferase involved in cell wall biosynthesis